MSTAITEKPTRYLITAPIAFDPQALATDPQQTLQIPKGPTCITDPTTGEKQRVERKKQVVILSRGRGFTTDPLAVDYLKEQWGDALQIVAVGDGVKLDEESTELPPDAAYLAELEEVAAQVERQANSRKK